VPGAAAVAGGAVDAVLGTADEPKTNASLARSEGCDSAEDLAVPEDPKTKGLVVGALLSPWIDNVVPAEALPN
jgi:hypothetical protein